MPGLGSSGKSRTAALAADEFARLLNTPPEGSASPAHIVGLEHEFEIREDGEQRDFRYFIHDVIGQSHSRSTATGPYAYQLDTGALLVCDGWEAELAIPPVELAQGALRRLPSLSGRHHARLRELLSAWGRHSGRMLELRGYSTHFSAYCSLVDIDRLCAIYAQTFAPAMMLMSDLRTSPGLLVRPRERRFEVGSEFVPPGEYLSAAAAFFIGSFLALWEKMLTNELESIPIWFDGDKVEFSEQRYGYFVDGSAFGDDLHSAGRAARLRMRDGGRICGQEVLESAWALARPALATLATKTELETVDHLVSGRRPLPLEVADTEAYLTMRPAAAEPAEKDFFSVIFGERLQAFELARHRVTPSLITWDYVIFRVVSTGRVFFANVPRRLLKRFFSEVDKGEALVGVFDGFAANSNAAPVLDVPEKAEAPGLYLAIDAEKLSVRTPWQKKPKKPPPERRTEGCSVRVIEEGDPESPPRIRICVPATRDGLTPIKPQEPIINAAAAGAGVMLHCGVFHHQDLDLQVRSIGFPFQLLRHYRSGIDYNGILGRGWDHIYNKRVVPSSPPTAQATDFGWCEEYSGPAGPPSGDLEYLDGRGRRTFHAFDHWEDRTVRKAWGDGRLKTFRAVVTTYKMNPGERWLIKRYAVFEGDAGWDDPIFYELRAHDGTLIIFNCHGWIIAWQDRHGNIMLFRYGLPVNPATLYLVLRQVIDTTRRPYTLDYQTIAGEIRLITLDDPFARRVSFFYNGAGELTDVVGPGGQHPENKRSYRYRIRPGLLAEAVAAAEAAQGGVPEAYLENRYDGNERVVSQRYGAANLLVGGTSRFEYVGQSVSAVVDRRGERVEYGFEPLHDTFMMTSRTVINQPRTIPGITLAEPDRWTTKTEYDSEFRVSHLVKPGGSEEFFRYEDFNFPLARIGEERDWVEADLTWDNALGRGNLLERTVISYRAQDADRLHGWTWEPLFNQPLSAETPLGTTRFTYQHGSYLTPEKNGVPVIVDHPAIVGPSGTSQAVQERNTYRKGGLLARHTDPDGVTTEYKYDDNGALAQTLVDPGGKALATRFVNDARGNPLFTIDPGNRVLERKFDNRDNAVEEIEPTGYRREFFYDHNDRLIRSSETIADLPATFAYPMERPRQVESRVEYDILGQTVARVKDARGLALREEFAYDPEGNLIEHRLPRATGANPQNRANRIQWIYDSRGHRFQEFAGQGSSAYRDVYWRYDPDGNLALQRRADGGIWTFAHNGFDELIEGRDPIGVVEEHTLDAAGRIVLSRVFGPPGGPSPVDRSGAGNIPLSEVRYERDAYLRAFRRTAVEFEIGATAPVSRDVGETTTWTPGGRLDTETDGSGRETRRRYDTAGRLERIEYPGGHSIQYTLSATDQILLERRVGVVEGTGIGAAPPPFDMFIERTYDPMDRVRSESHPGGGTVEYAYDTRGLLRATRLANSGTQTYRYDTAGRQVEVIVPNGTDDRDVATLITQYDRNGQAVERVDGLGKATKFTYDALDRLSDVTDPDGRVSRVEYDGEGHIVLMTNRALEEVRTSFDAAGRPTRRIHANPAGQQLQQSFEWNGLGSPTRLYDNNDGGSTTALTWNSLGRLKRENQDGFESGYEYDPSGQLTGIKYPSNQEISIGQSPSGKPILFTRQGNDLARYRYRGARLDERSIDIVLTAPSGRYTYPLIKRFSYNNLGQLAGLSHHLRDVHSSPGNPIDVPVYGVDEFRYDQAGRMTAKRAATFAETYKYDRANRLIRSDIDPSDNPDVKKSQVIYRYDSANNLSERDETRTLANSQTERNRVERFYNDIHALTAEQFVGPTGASLTRQVGTDIRGNVSETEHMTPVGSLTYPGKRRLFYDALGRLYMVVLETNDPNLGNYRITFRYDGMNRRVGRRLERVTGPANTVRATVETRYVFWSDRCIEEHERRDGVPWQMVRRYVHGVGTGELIALDVSEDYVLEDIDNSGQVQGLATLVPLDDYEKSVIGLVRTAFTGPQLQPIFERVYTDAFGNTQRYVYDAAGNPIAVRESPTDHGLGHHGRRMHEKEKLYYTGRRFYDPALGRFISRDPIGAWGDPIALGNAYAASGNNGIAFSDNTGELVVVAAYGVILVGAWWVGSWAAAEYTRSDFVAGFSPGHQASVVVHGEEHFSGRPVSGWERGLAFADVILSAIPGGGFFGKGAIAAGRSLRVIARARSADMIVDALRVGHGVASVGYGISVGIEHGSGAQIGLLAVSAILQAAHLRAWARSFRSPPYRVQSLDWASSNAGYEQVGTYIVSGADRPARMAGVFGYELLMIRSCYDLLRGAEVVRAMSGRIRDDLLPAAAARPARPGFLQRARQFLGTVEPPNHGLRIVLNELETRARQAGAGTLTINGYYIINPHFGNRSVATFIAKQLGFDAYSFMTGGQSGMQLVRQLN